MSLCKPAASAGVKILHGNRGYFHSESQPIFKNIYQAIEEYRFLTSVEENIIDKIEMNIAKSNCDKVMEDFLHIPRQISKKLDNRIAEFESY
jgi:UDP-xylose:glucoside alpha-1,3-xylosyltransferase